MNVSHILATLPVGLEPLTTGTWNVFFGPIHLGWLDEHDYRIHDRRGRTQRDATCHPSGEYTCYPSVETFTWLVQDSKAMNLYTGRGAGRFVSQVVLPPGICFLIQRTGTLQPIHI